MTTLLDCPTANTGNEIELYVHYFAYVPEMHGGRMMLKKLVEIQYHSSSCLSVANILLKFIRFCSAWVVVFIIESVLVDRVGTI